MIKFRSNRIVLLGDTHSISPIKDFVLNVIPEGWDIFHLGDVSIGFREYSEDIRQLKDLNLACSHKNIRVYLLAGNHDNYNWWKDPIKLSNVIFVPHYTTISFPNKKTVLCVGGGVSVDRCHRNIHIDYWDNEITPDVPENLPPHDFVFAHDCPSYICHSTESLKKSFPNFIAKDPELLKDCHLQREKMDKIVNIVKPSRWSYGHYHLSYEETHNNCNFRCHDINELREFNAC